VASVVREDLYLGSGSAESEEVCKSERSSYNKGDGSRAAIAELYFMRHSTSDRYAVAADRCQQRAELGARHMWFCLSCCT